MAFFENLNLNKWWKFVLYFGGILIIASLSFQPEFLNIRYLFGLGVGLILIGLSYWISYSEKVDFLPPNINYGGSALKVTRKFHSFNRITLGLLILGLFLSLIFGVLLIISLF